MGEWREVEFEDVLVDRSISYGIVQPGSHIEENSVPIIRVQDIKNGRITTDDVKKVAIEVEAKHQKTRLKGGELLITVVGSVGETAFVPDELKGWNVARAVSVANIIDGVDKRFVRYAFATEDMQFQMYGNTNDTVQPTLNLKELKTLTLLLPSLPEQKAIAEVLSSLDDKIDLLHKQNQTLEALAETLFRHTFIDNAQDDWEEVPLGQLVETNVRSIKKDYPHEIIQYLDTGSLTRGITESYQEVSLEDAPSRAKRLVEHNDVLISTVRPNQQHYGIVKNPIENLVVSTGFCVISCTKIDPHFVYVLLTTDEMTEHLHMLAEASTSAYPSLKPSDIETLDIQLPPDDLLNQFARQAKSFWSKIEDNHSQIQTLKNLRDTLLPKLMSGDIRVAYEDTHSETEAA